MQLARKAGEDDGLPLAAVDLVVEAAADLVAQESGEKVLAGDAVGTFFPLLTQRLGIILAFQMIVDPASPTPAASPGR